MDPHRCARKIIRAANCCGVGRTPPAAVATALSSVAQFVMPDNGPIILETFGSLARHGYGMNFRIRRPASGPLLSDPPLPIAPTRAAMRWGSGTHLCSFLCFDSAAATNWGFFFWVILMKPTRNEQRGRPMVGLPVPM